MRYDSDHKQKTRERVLEAAAEAIRLEGPHKVGVAGVMARAGLTHGGFYAHFASKEDLVVAAIGHMFDTAARRRLERMDGQPPAEGLAGYIDFYLSPGHRDARLTGCPIAALAADLPRLNEEARARFAHGVARMAERIGQSLSALGRADAEDLSASAVAEMVGALSLARVEPDPARSDQILERSRRVLKRRLGLEA